MCIRDSDKGEIGQGFAQYAPVNIGIGVAIDSHFPLFGLFIVDYQRLSGIDRGQADVYKRQVLHQALVSVVEEGKHSNVHGAFGVGQLDIGGIGGFADGDQKFTVAFQLGHVEHHFNFEFTFGCIMSGLELKQNPVGINGYLFDFTGDIVNEYPQGHVLFHKAPFFFVAPGDQRLQLV